MHLEGLTTGRSSTCRSATDPRPPRRELVRMLPESGAVNLRTLGPESNEYPTRDRRAPGERLELSTFGSETVLEKPSRAAARQPTSGGGHKFHRPGSSTHRYPPARLSSGQRSERSGVNGSVPVLRRSRARQFQSFHPFASNVRGAQFPLARVSSSGRPQVRATQLASFPAGIGSNSRWLPSGEIV